MQRSATATLRRTLRRTVTWRPKRLGRRPLRIEQLISPLRYDVLVRASFFEFLAARPAGESDSDLVAAAAEEPYAVWFRDVAMTRFRPWVLKDPEALEENFRERVLASRALRESFEANGFDRSRPVTLRVSRGELVADSGAVITRTVHVGDGGHRLALLLQTGSALLPGMYRLDPRPMPLIDNTSVLLGPLRVTDDDYLAFIGKGYTEQPFHDERSLLQVVRDADPAAGTELESVLAVHRRARLAVE